MGGNLMGGTVRAVGIDPGTVSFGVCGLEGDRLFLDTTIPSEEVAANPQVLVDLLQSVAPVDMIVGPSGYGLPWVSARDLRPRDVDLLVLSEKRDRGRAAIVGGMREMLRLLKGSGLPIYFAPAVIHLPTVPQHRKANRIDMGTADKLCSVALGIYDQARHLNIAYEETAFIYVEIGGAFTATIAVRGGKVVDGLGGTSGSLGYLSLGAMDGELAYLLGSFHKEVLCSGGVAYIAGQPNLSPQALVASTRTGERSRLAWDAFMESLVKGVAAEITVVPYPREILLAGRLCRIPEIRQEVVRRLSPFAPVRRVEGFAKMAKAAAQGAALIASGLAGGTHERLVEVMELREASGTVLDHLYVAGAETLRRRYGGMN
ncbi:MAG TPA: DUF1464 domain-containing protein [Anaerolineae bacterium]|nr:DUF1464 domain-containing protein [Anaerolineae bacterium]